jgi:3',5'-cyclic AMP phosphodiesterase CpdA
LIQLMNQVANEGEGRRRSPWLAVMAVPFVGLLLTAQQPPAPLPESPPSPSDAPPVLLAAGDIAKCEILNGAVATARLLDRLAGTVLTLGDNAYDAGTREQFQKCYAPTWGRHLERTKPAPGNHDYGTRNAAGYFEYFGDRAGPAGRGYYSFDLGSWHIVSLNSFIASGHHSPQSKWLADDLAAHPAECTLAYFHVPVFSSGPHGGDPLLRDLWRQLSEAGADIVLSGHDHHYERFAPLDANGHPDPNGTRQFVVGTGGGGVYRFKGAAPNSEVRDNSTYGVLKLVLLPGRYEWTFVPVNEKGFTDSGSGTCSPVRQPK